MNATELQGFPISVTAPNTGQALVWNGSLYVPENITNTGPAGGDLAGNYPNPVVTGIQGIPVDTTGGGVASLLTIKGGPTRWGLTPVPLANGQSPVWNSGSGSWAIDFISNLKDLGGTSRPINGNPRAVGNVITWQTDPDTGTFGWNAQPPSGGGPPPGAQSFYTALTSFVTYIGGANQNILAATIAAGIWCFIAQFTFIPTSPTAFELYIAGSASGPLAAVSNFMNSGGQDGFMMIMAAFNIPAQTIFAGMRGPSGINASIQAQSNINSYGGVTAMSGLKMA